MTYSLRRISDDAGDSGHMSESILYKEGEIPVISLDSKPILGECMRVGTNFSRSFSSQDWWLTTPVTEIIEEKLDEVRFRTGNSEYIWKRSR